jgi:putative tryptophan/tyrosine transport system substrate-binding protein
MHKKLLIRLPDFCSHLRKSKIRNAKWPGFFAILALFLGDVRITEAQQLTKIPRLGALLYSNPETDPNFAAFRQGLRERGYVEGQNLLIEHYFADQKPERLPDLAAELVRVKPDLIFALGGDVVPFAQKATKTIPIVMWVSNDPVEMGFVASLARPGGNITGITLILDELAGKRMALLKEVMPRISRVAVLWNPDHADPEFREIQREAKALGVRLKSLEVRRGDNFERQFHNARTERSEAIIVVSSRLMQGNRQRILEFAAKNRLPVIGDWGRWAPDGALLSYGPDVTAMVSRTAIYVDKIIKGVKPSDLPVERPTKFELVINLKTAKQIGVTISPNVLARADKVIR